MDSAKIFIDTDNEITFILEKILAAKSDRVCLVVPDRASLFTSISGLKLIKRVIDKSKKLIVLVTLDANGSALSKNAGLIVVSRVGEISESLWEEAQKSKFEFVKKQKNKVYYQPDEKASVIKKDEPKVEDKKISIQDLIKADLESSNSENLEESSQIVTPSEPIDPDFDEEPSTEIPQVRIRVEDKEVANAYEEEISSQKEIENEVDREGLENARENVKNSRFRMRKTAENTTPLDFTFGEDVNPQKKK